ncbi:MAG: tRNA epoxyqueuosine(34) reductase QueG [FCB group bacterium]|nr:tRNA epoxyqueuosine(34) reductase QueG [FCB group bacterium]
MNKNLSSQIKERAYALGFQKVGFTRAEFIPGAGADLESWLQAGYHASMYWMEKRKNERENIFTYFPEVKSVISLGMNYYTGVSEKIVGHGKSRLNFSNYAWGEDYHGLMKKRMYHLLAFIRNTVDGVKGVVCVDTSPVMEKIWARKAGLGWQGKHTNLISRDFGSWLFLGEVLLNIELEYDPPFEGDLCGSCTACLEACPTGALTANRLDANKCISYLTIEHRGDLPEAYVEKLNGWIYGCDICQEVCPWNRKFSQPSPEPAFQPKPEIRNWSEEEWLSLRESDFRAVFKNSAVKRTKYAGLKRNIKAAIGGT